MADLTPPHSGGERGSVKYQFCHAKMAGNLLWLRLCAILCFRTMLGSLSRAIAAICAVPEQLRALNDGTQGRLGDIQEALEGIKLLEATAPELVDDPRIAALALRIDELTSAVSEGILRVQRSENRVRAIVQGARRELAEQGFEHAGVEAELEQLRIEDGNSGEPQPVPAVPASVEDVTQVASSIPGVTLAEVRKARGY